MLAKLGSRWWLILLCAFLTAFAGFLVAAHINYTLPVLYVGQTTLLATETTAAPATKLASLAGSRNVLSNSTSTLADLGISTSPKELLAAMTVTPVKDTNIILIDVIMPESNQAKVTADVITNRLKKEFERLYPTKSGAAGVRIIEPAYVRLAKPHQKLRLAIGLTAGMFAGALLGIILAAAIPRKETRNAT